MGSPAGWCSRRSQANLTPEIRMSTETSSNIGPLSSLPKMLTHRSIVILDDPASSPCG